MEKINIGDQVICVNGVEGEVINQYCPTPSSNLEMTTIRTAWGELYHAPTSMFTHKVKVKGAHSSG